MHRKIVFFIFALQFFFHHQTDSVKLIETLTDDRVVSALAVLDNNQLASGLWTNAVLKVWNTSSSTKFTTKYSIKISHYDRQTSLVELYNGLVAIGSEDRNIDVVNIRTGKSAFILTGHSKRVTALVAHDGGKQLVSGSLDNTVIVWNVVTGKLKKTFTPRFGEVNQMLTMQSGQVAIGFASGAVQIYDMNDLKVLQSFLPASIAVTSLAELDTGFLAIGDTAGNIRLLDLFDFTFTNSTQLPKAHSNKVTTLVALSNGRLASGSSDRLVKVWNTRKASILAYTLSGHSDMINCLIKLDGDLLASGDDTGGLKVWDLANGGKLKWESSRLVNTGHRMAINAIVLLDDRRRMVTGSEDKSMKVWDLEV